MPKRTGLSVEEAATLLFSRPLEGGLLLKGLHSLSARNNHVYFSILFNFALSKNKVLGCKSICDMSDKLV